MQGGADYQCKTGGGGTGATGSGKGFAPWQRETRGGGPSGCGSVRWIEENRRSEWGSILKKPGDSVGGGVGGFCVGGGGRESVALKKGITDKLDL